MTPMEVSETGDEGRLLHRWLRHSEQGVPSASRPQGVCRDVLICNIPLDFVSCNVICLPTGE